jgi:cell division protein FtsB
MLDDLLDELDQRLLRRRMNDDEELEYLLVPIINNYQMLQRTCEQLRVKNRELAHTVTAQHQQISKLKGENG